MLNVSQSGHDDRVAAPGFRLSARTISLVLGLLAIAVILWARYDSIQHYRYHDDEVIAVKVAEMMVHNHTFNTDWENADLASYFKYPQYNFSGYMIFCAGVLDVARMAPALDHVDTLVILRDASFVLGGLGVLLAFLTGRRFFGERIGLLSAVLVGVYPLLFQDGLYARPETFVSALTLLLVYVLSLRGLSRTARAAIGALIIGVLIGTKISMVLLLPLLVLADDRANGPAGLGADILDYFRSCLRSAVLSIPVIVPATALGFISACPYALADSRAFWNGLHVLNQQYTTGHWPHGLADGTIPERFGYAVTYFASTAGWPLLLAPLVAVWFLVKERRLQALGVLLLSLAFFVRFSTYPVFFERNLSHIVPILCIFSAFAIERVLAALPIRPVARWALATTVLVVVLVPPIGTIYRLMAFELSGRNHRAVERLRTGLESRYGVGSEWISWVHNYSELKPKIADVCSSRLIEVSYPGDRYSVVSLRNLKEIDGFSEVGRFTSSFSYVPPSTLHTYFTPTTIFYFRPGHFEHCPDKTGLTVSSVSAGDPLPTTLSVADPAWTKGGAYVDFATDPFGSKDYYGSWSGSDSYTGKMSFVTEVEGQKYIVLPYITGPTTQNQAFSVEDADTHKSIYDSGMLTPQTKWTLMLIHVPDGAKRIRVTASDQGAAWGGWLAVGFPRRYRQGG